VQADSFTRTLTKSTRAVIAEQGKQRQKTVRGTHKRRKIVFPSFSLFFIIKELKGGIEFRFNCSTLNNA